MVKGSKINVLNTKKIEEIIDEYAHEVVRITAGLIRDDLYLTATWSMAAFYSDYTPTVYYRYYKNFLGGRAFEKYYANPRKNEYYAGIKFTPENMKSVYKDDPEIVTESVFSGYHGPKGTKVTRVMSPSPYNILYKRRDYIEEHIGDFISKAQSMIRFG